MAHDVFISHSAKDKPTADAVCAGLESQGIQCWIAPRDVLRARDPLASPHPSTEWAPSIIDAIGRSKLVVLVYSANANESDQVRRELHIAVNDRVDILPFRIEDVPVSPALQWYLALPHWIDALTPPLEKHIDALADTIRGLLEGLTKAGEGEDHKRRDLAGLISQARQAMADERYEEAASLARRMLDLEPGHAEGASLREAATRLLRAQQELETRRDQVARLVTQGRQAMGEGRFEEAASLARRVLDLEPGHAEGGSLLETAASRLQAQQKPGARATQAARALARRVSNYARAHAYGAAGVAAALLLGIGLLIVRIPPNPVPQLAFDEPVSGILTSQNPSSRWQLVLPGADDFRVELTNLLEDYNLFVTGPDGRSASSTHPGREDDVAVMPAAAAGTYDVEVKASLGTSSEPYRLTARRGTGPTPVPTVAPTPPVRLAESFADNFNDPQSARLVSLSDPSYVVGYADGEYAIRKTNPNFGLLPVSRVTGSYADASLTIDARLFGGTEGRMIAVGCRENMARDSEYRLVLDPFRGQFRLYRFDEGKATTLKDATTDPSIYTGNQVNRLELSCAGTTIAVRINGTIVESVQDGTYREGVMWIGAGSFSDSEVTAEARFDNLIVQRLGAGATPVPTFQPVRLPCADPGQATRPLPLGQPTNGLLSRSETEQRWVLTLPMPGNLRVQLSNLQVDYDLYVHLPDGGCRKSEESGPAVDVVEFPAPAGEYRIVVRAATGVTSGQPYRLLAELF